MMQLPDDFIDRFRGYSAMLSNEETRSGYELAVEVLSNALDFYNAPLAQD